MVRFAPLILSPPQLLAARRIKASVDPSADGRRSFGRRKPSTKKEAEMLGLEDVAAYKDLFSPEDWNAIQTDEWDRVDDQTLSPPDEPHDVIIYVPRGL